MSPPIRPSPILEGRSKTLLLVLVGVALTLIYGAAIFPLTFVTNDDVAMAGIVRGLSGSEPGEPRLIFQSAFLGFVIGALFELAPGFDWYSSFQWLVCLGSLVIVGFVWLQRSRSPLSLFAFLALGTIFYAPILFHMQFTQTSLVCIAAAVVLLLDTFDAERPIVWQHGAALGMATLGALIRSANQTAAQALLFAAALYVAAWMAMCGRSSAIPRKLAANLGLVLVFSLTIAGIERLESRIFYAQPEWQEFWENRQSRSYVMHNWPRDVGLPRIAAALERELELTSQQYAAILRWIPIDEERYSSRAFASMAAVIRDLEPTEVDSFQRLSRSWAEFRAWLESESLLLHGVAFILLLALCQAVLHPQAWLPMLATGFFWPALLVALLFGITHTYRAPPYRVWMPLLATIAISSAYCQVMWSSRRPNALSETEWARLAPAGVLVLFLAGLKWLAPLHEDFRSLAAMTEHRRVQECGLADLHLRAFDALPEGGKIFLATQVVKSHCFVTPMRLEYPEVLRERTISFGWQNLTPWARSRLFAEDSDLFDSICADPRNALVMNPIEMPIAHRYLARHKPGMHLAPFSSAMPPAILRCETTPLASHDRGVSSP